MTDPTTTATTGTPAGGTTDTPAPGARGFAGWPPDAPVFLAELAQDNTREFWLANVHRYRAALLAPTRALAAELAAEFGAVRVFRPHVDRRFRPAADPYRTDAGLTASWPGGTPHALVLSPRGLAVQVGPLLFDAEQRRRYREAVDGAPGEDLVAVLARLHDAGLAPDGVAALASRPRGCPRDHPRLPLMRLRGLHVDRAWPAGAWLATAEPLDRVRAAWRAARPLADWLDRNVGPRTDPVAAPRARAARAGDDGPVDDGAVDDGPATHS
jgi:uncharacterized protein (DUF2461 family)